MQKTHNIFVLVIFCVFLSCGLLPIVAISVNSLIKITLMLLVWLIIAHQSSMPSLIKYCCLVLPCFSVAIFILIYRTLALDDRFLEGLYAFLNIFTPAIMYLFIVERKDVFLVKYTTVFVIMCFVVTAITTYVGNLIFPGASKFLGATIEDHQLYQTYMSYNIGGFDFTYFIVLILPYFIFTSKRGKYKLLNFGVLLMFLICILKTEFSFAVLFAILSLSLFFAKQTFTRKGFYLFLIAVVLLFVLIRTIIPSLMIMLSSHIESKVVSDRFYDVALMLEGKNLEATSDVVMRKDTYMESIEGFLSSPLWGTFDHGGGHSYILDVLCIYGLFGALMLYYMLVRIYKLYFLPHKKTSYYGYLLFTYCLYIMGLIFNPQPYLICVTFVIPLLYYNLALRGYGK